MNQESLENTLSLVPLGETDLTKPIKFFDPNQITRELPTYNSSLRQKINEIINSNEDIVPFNILFAKKETVDEKEILELKGKYETFDGLIIEVNFKGTYGDPDKRGLAPPLMKDDSFSSYDLEARVIGADTRQETIFSMIGLRDRDICFSNGRLKNIKPEYEYVDLSSAGLDNIRKIGKIVSIYEQLHIKNLIKIILEKKDAFQKDLAEIPFTNYKLDFRVAEFEAPDEEINLILKHFRDVVYEFIPILRFEAIKNIDHRRTIIQYNVALNQEEGIWRIDVDWPDMMKIRNLFHKYRLADIDLPEDLKIVHQRIRFLLDAFGFHIRDPNDIIDAGYDAAFNHAVLDAREEILQKNPDYQPLYLTANEGNNLLIHYMEDGHFHDRLTDGTLRFRTKEAYAAFEMMTLKTLNYDDGQPRRITEKGSHKSDDVIGQIIKDRDVQKLLDRDPLLKHRIMMFYEFYKQNPENTLNNFYESDPAYVRGRELDKQRQEEIQKEIKEHRK